MSNWKMERDALVNETMAFVEAVRSQRPISTEAVAPIQLPLGLPVQFQQPAPTLGGPTWIDFVNPLTIASEKLRDATSKRAGSFDGPYPFGPGTCPLDQRCPTDSCVGDHLLGELGRLRRVTRAVVLLEHHLGAFALGVVLVDGQLGAVADAT